MRVFCFLCVFFVPCLLCVTILAQRYCCWQEAFWTVSKKACASFVDPQHCCREKKWRPWIRQSNRIQSYSFLSSALPPTLFKSPQTHTHTHTPEVWTPRLPSKEANISRTRPFSGETEKFWWFSALHHFWPSAYRCLWYVLENPAARTYWLYLLVAFCVHMADNACFWCSARIGMRANWSNTRCVLCARTHRQSFRNKISQPFMMEVVGNRRKSWGVVGSLKKLV